MYESISGVAVDRPNRDRDVAVRGDRDRAPGFGKTFGTKKFDVPESKN